jgi:hypothetical protein
MLVPDLMQIYLGGSKIFGEYGDPWDARLGVNLHPFKNQVVRWNTEVVLLRPFSGGRLEPPLCDRRERLCLLHEPST